MGAATGTRGVHAATGVLLVLVLAFGAMRPSTAAGGTPGAFGVPASFETSAWFPDLPPPAPPVVPTPCRHAQALLLAGLLREAAIQFHAAARVMHGRPALRSCVASGMSSLWRVRSERTELLVRQGRKLKLTNVTIERLVAVVQLGPRPDLVPRVVAHGLERRAGAYGMAIAAALHGAGFNAQANAVVRATLRRFPAADVPPELRGIGYPGLGMAVARALSRAGFDAAAAEELRAALEADPTAPVPAELEQADRRLPFWNDARGRYGTYVRTAVEILLTLLIAVVTVVLLLQMGARLTARLSIEDFTAPEDGYGPTTAASVRENYSHVRDDDGGARLRFTDSSAESFSELRLPAGVTEAVPRAAFADAVLALLDRLLPSRRWRVSGQLQPLHPSRGAGLGITLTRYHGSVIHEETLWENDYGPWSRPAGGVATQENYDRVAMAAAAWLVYMTARKNYAYVLGARRWQSYASFAVGADLQARGLLEDACIRYRRALGIDPDNRGARVNLAISETQVASEKRMLVRALAMLADLSREVSADRDPMWYRIAYSRAAALLRPGPLFTPWAARVIATNLCATIMSKPVPDYRLPRELVTYLPEVERTALLLLAGALFEDGQPSAGPQTPTTSALRAALAEAKDAGGWLEAVSHDQIVRSVLRARDRLRPGARYNLACYYVRTRDMVRAEDELHRALQEGDAALRRLAVDDPVLRRFTNARGRRERLGALLRRLGTI